MDANSLMHTHTHARSHARSHMHAHTHMHTHTRVRRGQACSCVSNSKQGIITAEGGEGGKHAESPALLHDVEKGG